MSQVFNIIGPAGSGKTYLLEVLKKQLGDKCIYIDTDDIDDKNSLNYLKSHEIDQKNIDVYFKKLKESNDTDIKKILTNANKPVVISGLSINVVKYTKKGYCIRIDPENHYRQLMKRTLDDIHQNYDALQKLLKSKHSTDHIFELALKKYKIRYGFIIPPRETEKLIQYYYNNAKQYKYKIMTFDEIYADILRCCN